MESNLMSEKQHVEELKTMFFNKQKELSEIRYLYETSLKTFQNKCPHTDYTKEIDHDYHSTGFIYTCKLCGYMTRMTPTTKNRNTDMYM